MSITDGLDLIGSHAYAEKGVPHDVWTRLRAESPVHRCVPSGFAPFWAITKHADVCEISKQPDKFSSAKGIASFVEKGGYSHVFAPVSNNTKDFVPRIAAALGVSPVTDICEVVSEDTFVRPFYAGNALATVKTTQPVTVATVRATAFEKVEAEGGAAGVVRRLAERLELVERDPAVAVRVGVAHHPRRLLVGRAEAAGDLLQLRDGHGTVAVEVVQLEGRLELRLGVAGEGGCGPRAGRRLAALAARRVHDRQRAVDKELSGGDGRAPHAPSVVEAL